jgi:lipid A ethanolaminephosphotransferase
VAVVSAIAQRASAARLVRQRPRMRIESMALATSLFFSVVCNTAFWRHFAAVGGFDQPGGMATAASIFIATTALTTALLCLATWRWNAKPLLAASIVATVLAAHFMDHYGAYLDTDMIHNVLETDRRESMELANMALATSLLCRALPALTFLAWVELAPAPGRRGWLVRGASVLAAILLAVVAMAASYQGIATLMRNHPDLRHLITPGNYLVSLARVAARGDNNGAREPVGLDARVAPATAARKPRLLVIVVGETVRAQNWGLNGYERQTTPQLARIRNVVNFSDVTACGTSTAVSLPCMFSPYGRRGYDADRIRHSESLLHVLDHAGIATDWRDNQGGCKHACDGLPFESYVGGKDETLCDAERCLDEILLQGLDRRIRETPGDMVVVLHQVGNHGPAYYRRYPGRLARFEPACTTADLAKCSRAQIVNAYDNAILYTDDFLARTIHLLAGQDSHDAAMIYVSDHGESLGEHGLYLHGMPHAIAPDTQTRVPMTLWLSPRLVDDSGIDLACMEQVANQPASHDNLFHSVLGLMRVRTTAYDRNLDVFAPCDAVGFAHAAQPPPQPA